MKNSSLAMISTIALVVALAAMVGFVDSGACVNPQVAGWSDCESAATQKLWMFWGGLAIATASYTTYRIQLWQKRRERD